jgi:adenine-specific DNA methylase
MRLSTDVDATKLRGGFYTPESVVRFCIDRIRPGSRAAIRVLEPSSGDGAFIRGLGSSSLGDCVEVTAVELISAEADKSRVALRESRLVGQVTNTSFFTWAATAGEKFDAVIGNPPFVRYQFVPSSDRIAAERCLARRGLSLDGVSNLWIPFVLESLSRLRSGGRFALVLPHELLATVSGEQVRRFLIREFRELRIDLFPRDTFVDILQDVLVVSGTRRAQVAERGPVVFVQHGARGTTRWRHLVEVGSGNWTRFLLTTEEVEAFEAATGLRNMKALGEVARIQVSIVTGANAYFTVSRGVVDRYELGQWARPLIARSEQSSGLVVTVGDHKWAEADGKRTWLLDFNGGSPDPMMYSGSRTYLGLGTDSGIHARYKCRIRDPWYRIPHVATGALLMSKRSHQHHRLLHNPERFFTTDTIYRGEMLPRYASRERDLVAGFHNSLTLLAAELEGRTYGGGVLEMVPSEIARLPVPLLAFSDHLEVLDSLSRDAGGQKDDSGVLIDATDELLGSAIPGYSALVPLLESGRRRLVRRRLGDV